jgi:hypothetical protein
VTKFYFETDELNELKDSIQFSYARIKEYLDTCGHIKWPVIATANSLQCACVFFIDGNDTSGLETLSQANRNKWLKTYRAGKGTVPPSPFLATPAALYEKALNIQNLPYHTRKLFELRNDFIHFTPGSMSIEISELIHILSNSWDDICEILNKPREQEHRYDTKDIKYVCETSKKIKSLLK